MTDFCANANGFRRVGIGFRPAEVSYKETVARGTYAVVRWIANVHSQWRRHRQAVIALDYASLRARKAERVSKNLAASGSRSANQSEIWGDIACKSRRMRAESPTAAMAAMYEGQSASLEGFIENLRARPGQCGVVFAIQGRITGLDLFDDSATLGKLYPKLIGSYALDALDTKEGAFTDPGIEDAQRLVSEIMDATQVQSFPAIGEGTDMRISGPQVTGSALVAGERPIHVCAFYRERAEDAERREHRAARTDLARASLRRHRRKFRE